ncbi:putative membrane protein insertion efficiency factor [bacterium MnTg02]|nr:putative membrane protein insertion efficiency factor [bacterium MnTg02]
MSLPQSIARIFFLAPIWIYRFCVSPFMGPSCRHLPTCSEYAADAIERNGAWKGSWLALSRLLRCHPWGSHGLDPVPDLRHIDHRWMPWRYGRWTGAHIKEKVGEAS